MDDREKLIKKIEDDILMDFVEDEHGEFQYKGKYYSPKFGCDMLIWMVDGVYGLLVSEIDKANQRAITLGEMLYADCSEYKANSAKWVACRTYNERLYSLLGKLQLTSNKKP